jgi:AcrR family transcriptional regulator
MRVKTDERREAILQAAWEVFKTTGFERATMSEISRLVGGSKATLYGYFQSKEELFATALERAIQERAEAPFLELQSSGTLSTCLLRFARAYLDVRLARDMIAVSRALICEADRTDLGAALQSRFVTPQWRRLADILEQRMAAGELRHSDPYVAAVHFRGLIESDILERRLHSDAVIDAKAIEDAVVSGVEAFLRAYAK